MPKQAEQKWPWVMRVLGAIVLVGLLLAATDWLVNPAWAATGEATSSPATPAHNFAVSSVIESGIITAPPETKFFGLVKEAQAQTVTPAIPRPGNLPGPNPPSVDTTGKVLPGQDPISYFKAFLGGLTRSIIGVLGFLAVFFIVYGGFLYVTSAGDPEKAGKGKTIFMYSVIGLLLAAFAYAIVSTVVSVPKALESGIKDQAKELGRLKQAEEADRAVRNAAGK